MMPSTPETKQIIDRLAGTCQDAQEGFEAAAALVADSALKAELLQYSLQCADFLADLERLRLELGETPDFRQATPNANHHGWTHLNGLIDASDVAVLAACARGTETAMTAYRRALNTILPEFVAVVVASQCHAIWQVYECIRALRTASMRKAANVHG